MRMAFILGNCAMYFIFVIFIFLIAILPSKQKVSPCFIGSSDSQSGSVTYRIKLAYWIFQAVVVILVSASWVIGAILLTQTFLKSSGPKSGKRTRYYTQIYIITSVAVVCIVFLLIRSALFLWAAKTGRSLNVIVFVILEVIPQAMLLFYMHPFRCFTEEGRSSSRSNSRTRTTSQSKHTESTGSKSASHVSSW